jgi:hypothetical protein
VLTFALGIAVNVAVFTSITLVAASLMLVAVVLLATWFPALRATRIDPAAALILDIDPTRWETAPRFYGRNPFLPLIKDDAHAHSTPQIGVSRAPADGPAVAGRDRCHARARRRPGAA